MKVNKEWKEWKEWKELRIESWELRVENWELKIGWFILGGSETVNENVRGSLWECNLNCAI